MTKSLLLSKLVPVNNSPVLFDVPFGTVFDIEGAEGVTKLANDIIYFLLTTYNEDTNVGTKLKSLITTPLVIQSDLNLIRVRIVDEVADAVVRFKAFQAEHILTLPLEEQLQEARIISIDVDTSSSSVLVQLEVINILNQRARFQV
jgi:GTP:adenosylcobinamide-phosphate guanylyltransferase